MIAQSVESKSMSVVSPDEIQIYICPLLTPWFLITDGGKSVTVAVETNCPGCGPTDLDLSEAAFAALADLSLGRIEVTWSTA